MSDTYTLVADVSSNNGKINFATMADKVSGVIIRAGYRGYSGGGIQTDAKYYSNIAAAEAVGLPVGVYWYTTAKSMAEAQAEADKLLELVSGHNLAYPVWLDLEYAPGRKGRADKLSSTRRTKYAVAWLERVKAAGYDVGVYCNADFWSDALDNRKLVKYRRWIARYGSKCKVSCDMWQYTSTATGKLYGQATGYLDLSRCYTDFSGTKADSKVDSTAEGGMYDMDTLRKGDKGQQVRALQIILNSRTGAGLSVDGIFGGKTEAAVKEYQQARGLTVDGIVGQRTWEMVLK